jgi:hypothetical protein
MKTIVLTILVCIFSICTLVGQLSDQPDYVGLTRVGNSFVGPYATLFEPTGKFFLTVRHSTFNKNVDGTYNHTLIFGNEQKCKVKTIHYFSSDTNSYDIAIGEIETAVTGVTIPKVWWQMPQDLKQYEIEIVGWSYLDGWFTGDRGYIYINNPVEVYKSIAYCQTSVRGGYSGAPIFISKNGEMFLIGPNWGGWPSSDPPVDSFQGGWVTPLFLVLQDHWNSFPSALLTPAPTKTELVITSSGPCMELILKSAPGSRNQVTASEDLSQWIPVHEKAGFIESVPVSQWETKVRWNKASATSAYFRAERQ